MQLRLLTAAVAFAGSYLPLAMILLAQNFDYSLSQSSQLCFDVWASECQLPLQNSLLSVSIFLVCLTCFAVTLIVLSIIAVKREIVLQEVKYVPAELMNYTLPYIVSFMSIDYNDTSKFVGLLIFLAWMFWITYKSGQVLLNPLLIVLGWRLYDVTYTFPTDPKNGLFSGLALSRVEIASGQTVRHEVLGDALLIERSL